jgi:hypothetical protein
VDNSTALRTLPKVIAPFIEWADVGGIALELFDHLILEAAATGSEQPDPG